MVFIINPMVHVFCVLPIFPLDVSKILYGLLPAKYEYLIRPVEQYDPFILMGVILFGWMTKISILGIFIIPVINFFSNIFGGV